MKIRKVGVEDKIDKEDRNNILELLRKSWSRNVWRLEDALENLRRDRDLVMAAGNHLGFSLEFASEDSKRDRDIFMVAVKHYRLALEFSSEDFNRDENIVMA